MIAGRRRARRRSLNAARKGEGRSMPIFITQGRFTRDAMAGMTARPEDRAQVVGKLAKAAGGKLLSYYFTFGEYDFLLIMEGPDEQTMAAALIVAASTGGVTDLKTTLAITSADAKKAFAAAGGIVASFRPAGTK
jgi:uncharacterized protein with GYD domain